MVEFGFLDIFRSLAWVGGLHYMDYLRHDAEGHGVLGTSPLAIMFMGKEQWFTALIPYIGEVAVQSMDTLGGRSDRLCGPAVPSKQYLGDTGKESHAPWITWTMNRAVHHVLC